jgi:uncharacterized membrane protein YgdD (TMEM256/DUF423 family)
MCSSNCWLTWGAVLAGLAVGAGAFAAHGLDQPLYVMYAGQTYPKKIKFDGVEKVVSEVPLAQKHLADFKTGAEYQMYHSLALLAVGLLVQVRPSRLLTIAGFCFVLGCLGFSGGLYAYALTDEKLIGQFIVPGGGLLFLAGWILFAAAACPCRAVQPASSNSTTATSS